MPTTDLSMSSTYVQVGTDTQIYPHNGAMSPATTETIESHVRVYPRTGACQELQVRPRLSAVSRYDAAGENQGTHWYSVRTTE